MVGPDQMSALQQERIPQLGANYYINDRFIIYLFTYLGTAVVFQTWHHVDIWLV